MDYFYEKILKCYPWGYDSSASYKQEMLLDTSTTTSPSDLRLLYASRCSSFGTILYCRNLARNGKIFKYIETPNYLYRVQCNCCTHDFKHHQMHGKIEEWSEKRVDDDSQNKLLILPKYSRFCKRQKKMVVFAAVYPNKTVEALIFNSETLKFEASSCVCGSCTNLQHSRDSHELGQQQSHFQRPHLDRFGRSLLCLSIDWYDEFNGLMSIFSNGNGDIGRYQYDKENLCYELEELLEVRVHESPRMTKVQRPIQYDSQLSFSYSQYCPSLEESIFFAHNPSNYTISKLTFSPIFNQFELINCQCCTFDASKMTGNEKILGFYGCRSIGGSVLLLRNRDCKVEKRIGNGEEWIVIGRSPVRYLDYETPRTFQLRRTDENSIAYSEHQSLLTDKELNEYYQLTDELVVDMTGRISYSPEVEGKKIQKPQELLDSHLIPQNVGFCDHLKTVMFSATNTVNPGVCNYIFDSGNKEIRQIHCCEANGRKVVPHATLTITKDPKNTVILKADAKGHLAKKSVDYECLEISYLPAAKVVRRLKYEENRKESPKPRLIDLFQNFLNHRTDPKPPAPEPFSLEDLAHAEDDIESTKTAIQEFDWRRADSRSEDFEDSGDEEDSEDSTRYPGFYKLSSSDFEYGTMLRKLAKMNPAFEKKPSDEMDVDSPIPELYDRAYRSELRADCLKQLGLDEESFKRIHLDEAGNYKDADAQPNTGDLKPCDVEDSEDLEPSDEPGDKDSDSDTTATALEPSGDKALDSESTATALEPSSVEDSDNEDAKSTATALGLYTAWEASRYDDFGDEDAETIATALEPSGDKDTDSESTATALEPSRGEDSDDEDAESTATALKPSDVEDSDNEDSESTATALKPSDNEDSDNEDSESTATALDHSDDEELSDLDSSWSFGSHIDSNEEEDSSFELID